MPLPPKILSVWGSLDGDDFLGSASLLDRDHVLTVQHLFVNFYGLDSPSPQLPRDRVYVADANIGPSAQRSLAKLKCLHDRHDAAILRLDQPMTHPVYSGWFMSAHRDLRQQHVQIHAVSPETKAFYSVDNYAIGGHDDSYQEWELSPSTAEGHSGGLITVQNEVVGLLCSRIPNQPLARAVCMHDLHDWIVANVAGCVFGSTVAQERINQGAQRLDGLLAAQPALAMLGPAWDRAGLTPQTISAVLTNLSGAIDVTRPRWTASPDLPEHPGATQRACLELVGAVLELAIDPYALRDWAGRDEVAPFKSAGLAAVCRALASGGRFQLSMARLDGHEVGTARTAQVSGALTAGVGPQKRQDIGRQFYNEIFPKPRRDEDLLDDDELDDLVSRMAALTRRDRVPFVVAGVASSVGQAGELSRIADGFRAQAAARTGKRVPGCPILFEPEVDLVQALLLCLEEIQRIT